MHLAPRQERGVVFGVLLAGLALLAARTVTPRSWSMLRERTALLVPLGLVVGAQAVLTWCAAWSLLSGVLLASTTIWFAQISLSFVAVLLLHAFYASWATVLVVDAARGRSGTPATTLAAAGAWFPRVLGIVFLCWFTLLLAAALAIAWMSGALPVALVFIAAITIWGNWLTVAVLPVAVTVEGTFFEAFAAGLRESRAGWRRWWKAVTAQLALLGFVTFLSVSYSSGGSHHSGTSWGINGFWVGGYESDSRWYSKYMESLDAPQLPWMVTVLALAFGVLALAAKLHVACELEDMDVDASAPDSPETPGAPRGGPGKDAPRRRRRPSPGLAARRSRRRRRAREKRASRKPRAAVPGTS